MRMSLLSRIERLEGRATTAEKRLKVRLGDSRSVVPDGYVGERHIAVTECYTDESGYERCIFEERTGPESEHSRLREDDEFVYLNVRFVDSPHSAAAPSDWASEGYQ